MAVNPAQLRNEITLLNSRIPFSKDLKKGREDYAVLACSYSESGQPYLRVCLEWDVAEDEGEKTEYLNLEHHKMIKLKPMVTQKRIKHAAVLESGELIVAYDDGSLVVFGEMA